MMAVDSRYIGNLRVSAKRLAVVGLALGLLCACVTEGPAGRFGNTDIAKAVEQYTALGLGYIQQGDTVKAKKPLKRALELAPRDPSVHNAFALLFQAEKEPDLADQYYQKALQYGPGETRIRNNYAAFLFSQRRYEDACQQLEQAGEDELYEKRAAVFENLGLCYLKLDKPSAALVSFQRAIAINDVQARALLEAAVLSFAEGDVKSSTNFHNRYQRLVRFRVAPNTARNLWLGVQLARLKGDKNKEASYALQLRNMFPNSPENLGM